MLIGADDTVMFCAASTPSLKPTFPTSTRNVGPGSVASLPCIGLPMGCNPSSLPFSLGLAVAVQALMPPMPAPSSFPTH